MPYDYEVKKLAPLETFDPDVFLGDSEYPQDLCDFILSLALAYDDFRDVTLARLLLRDIPIPDRSAPSTAIGQYGGLWVILIRIQVGFVHELLGLVKTNAGVITAAPFARIFKNLSKTGKAAWTSICDVAMGRNPAGDLAKVLVRIRNKLSFHYDSRELSAGYKSAFVHEGTTNLPFISRGDRLESTRFYFADAAAESYLKLRVDPDDDAAIELLWGGGDLLWQVNVALNEIVTRFIQGRSTYRRFDKIN